MQRILDRIEAEITLGTFDYKAYFPNSHLVQRFEDLKKGLPASPGIPIFEEFVKGGGLALVRGKYPALEALDAQYGQGQLKPSPDPALRDHARGYDQKGDVLLFRAELTKLPGQEGKSLSADRINHVMTTFRMALNEAADRFSFPSPWVGIKPLKIPRSEVDPFPLDEVRYFLKNVRQDFHNYYTVRFFTGMRTGEIDGLQWKYVDFERRLITVRETVVEGEVDTPQDQIVLSQHSDDLARLRSTQSATPGHG